MSGPARACQCHGVEDWAARARAGPSCQSRFRVEARPRHSRTIDSGPAVAGRQPGRTVTNLNLPTTKIIVVGSEPGSVRSCRVIGLSKLSSSSASMAEYEYRRHLLLVFSAPARRGSRRGGAIGRSSIRRRVVATVILEGESLVYCAFPLISSAAIRVSGRGLTGLGNPTGNPGPLLLVLRP